MTPDARARLVEVMAMGLADCDGVDWQDAGHPDFDSEPSFRDGYMRAATRAIAAAERAGFKWEEIEE